MGNKGGGRKGFVKAAAATKRAGPEEDTGADVSAQAASSKPDVAESAAARSEAGATDTSKPAPEESSRPGAVKAGAPPQQAACVASLDSSEEETRGQMVQRHKKEVKLQKDVSKKLGKKHKDEAARLEAELEARHAAELAAFDSKQPDDADADGDGAPGQPDLLNSDLYSVTLNGLAPPKQPTKAQKRREKQAAEAASREARIAAEQDAAGESDRVVEERALADLLAPLGLAVSSIPADGHCLYRAVEHQLATPPADTAKASEASEERSARHSDSDSEGPQHGSKVPSSYTELRRMAADWMRHHPDDFIPFLDQEEDGSTDDDTHAHFQQYCDDVEKTAAWGGQLELTALAHALQRLIVVHSVGMPSVEIGQQSRGKSRALQVCYLRHAYGLGEHYNSVVAIHGPPDHPH